MRVGGNNAAVTVPVALAVALNGVFQVAVFYQTFIKGNNAAHLVACVLVDKIDDRQIANYACSVGLTDNAVVPTGQNVDVFDCIALSVKRSAEILAVGDSVAFPFGNAVPRLTAEVDVVDELKHAVYIRAHVLHVTGRRQCVPAFHVAHSHFGRARHACGDRYVSALFCRKSCTLGIDFYFDYVGVAACPLYRSGIKSILSLFAADFDTGGILSVRMQGHFGLRQIDYHHFFHRNGAGGCGAVGGGCRKQHFRYGRLGNFYARDNAVVIHGHVSFGLRAVTDGNLLFDKPLFYRCAHFDAFALKQSQY